MSREDGNDPDYYTGKNLQYSKLRLMKVMTYRLNDFAEQL
jgi:hypothetical protein